MTPPPAHRGLVLTTAAVGLILQGSVTNTHNTQASAMILTVVSSSKLNLQVH